MGMRGTAEKAQRGQAGAGALCAGEERPAPAVLGHWLLRELGLHAFPSLRASQTSVASPIVSAPCAKNVLRNFYMYVFNPFATSVQSA